MKMITLLLAFTFSSHIFANNLSCENLKQSEFMALHKCDNLKVLILKGTPVERARMHGELMNSELSRDAMSYFSERVFQDIEEANFIVRGIFKTIYNRYVEKFHEHAPANYAAELKAQADGAKSDLLTIQRALALPDTSAFLVDMPARGFFKTFVTFGCTSFAKKNSDGHYFYARNLDFASTTIFDRNPLMTVQIPEEGSKELKHITFGTEGLQFGGITGVNEAGISFAVHQYMTNDAEKFGVPMIFVGEEVLRKAHNLQEAVEIIQKSRPGPMWAFVISDLIQQQTWVVEASSQNLNVRKMETDSFVQTNHILVSDQKIQMANAGFLLNSNFRFEKVLELLKASKSFAAIDAAKILSYQTDASGELSAAHDILKGETIQSIILESYKNKLEINISIDPAPASSGRFAKFDMTALFAAPEKINFEVNDLAKTDAAKRTNQLKLAQATHLQDLGKNKEAMDLFTDQKTVDAKIFRASSHYHLQEYEKTIKLLNELSIISAMDPLTHQSIQWLELLSLYKMKKTSEAKVVAENLLKQQILDSDLKKIATKVSLGKSLSDEDQAMRFSLFSGYLTNQVFQ